MDRFSTTLLFSCLMISLLCVPSLAQTCGTYTFTNSNQAYSKCNDLPQLSSFLHWNYHPTNMTADIAFRKTGASTSNWIAWALNPSGQRMQGSQALLAYRNSSGSMVAYTTSVDSTSPSMQPGSLSFNVTNLRADYVSTGDMIIFATLQLSENLVSTNQVWQEGPVSGDVPGRHPMTGDNMKSVGSVDFQSGTVNSTGATNTTGSGTNSTGGTTPTDSNSAVSTVKFLFLFFIFQTNWT